MSDRRRPARERPGFEDIHSSSNGRQSRPEWFDEARPSAAEKARRRQAERSSQRSDPRGKKQKSSAPSTRSTRERSSHEPPPQRPKSSRSSTRSPQPRGRPAPQGRRQPAERPRKKPMSLFKRRLLIVLVLLAMVLGTGFLAESLLLRVTEVRVTGDQVYAEEDVLRICGFKTGDNLLLIPARDREQKLETQLPYIAKAKITRRIPGTVQIQITAARGVCILQAGPEWYVIAAGGKVLESRTEPMEGLMQVIGLTPQSARIGEKLQLDNEEASTVFMELVNTIDKLGEDGQSADGRGAAGEFTKMDLTNLYDIRLWYQDRVECLLGSSNQLDYKVTYGYGNLTDEKGIGREETGVLDLTYLPTKKASYFTAGEATVPVQPTPGPDGTVPETTGPEGGGGEPVATPEPGRGSDIPDAPFTG